MMKNNKLILCKPGGIALGEIGGVRLETAELTIHLTNIWELTFEVDRYVDGKESAYYNSIAERMEILLLDEQNPVRFIIDQTPEANISSADMTEYKTVTAHSIECDLQSKQIRAFKVNCGTTDSQEYLVYDDNGNNMNAYSYGTVGSRLAIDQIYVDCRMENVIDEYYNLLFDSTNPQLTDAVLEQGLTAKIVKSDSDAYATLTELVSKCKRVQTHLTYDSDNNEILNCYVYTNTAGVIAIDGIDELKAGLEAIKQFYIDYHSKLSLIDLVLEQGKDGDWATWSEKISDDIAMSKWNFEVDSQDIYSFLTNTFANYAKAICMFDRYNKKIGVRYISELETDEFETGVAITLRNLAQTIDVTSTLDDGIKTKMYPTGSDSLGITYVNFNDYLIDLSYFMTKQNEYGELQYVSEDIKNAYETWHDYCYADEYTDADGTTFASRREAYKQYTKNYNQCIIDIDEINNLLPNDYCNVDYTNMQYDDLIMYWKAYMNSIQSLETLYESDYGIGSVYYHSEFPTSYPDNSTLSSNPSTDESILDIEDTIYFNDWYSFKYSMMPKIYESLKRWVATEEIDDVTYILMNDGTRVTLWGSFDPDDFQYIETGNPKYLNADDDYIANVDDWLYQWELYGYDELNNKYLAWTAAATCLFHETFLQDDNEITLHFYYDTDGKTILWSESEVTDEITSVVVKHHKDYETSSSDLSTDEIASVTESRENDEISYSITGWGTSFSTWLDYWGYFDCGSTRLKENTMTHRTKGFEALGVVIQAAVWRAIRETERTAIEVQQTKWNELANAIQSECSFDSYSGFTDEDKKIINQLLSISDYSNENIVTTSLDDIVTTIDAEEALYEDAVTELSKIAQPQYGFSTTMDNLFALDEFKPYREQMQVGNYVYLDTNLYGGNYQKLRVISIKQNPLIDKEDLEIEFSTMTKSLNGFSDLSFILDNMSSGSTSSSGGGSSSSSGTSYGENDAEITFSNNVLNALLSNNSVKTAAANAFVDAITSDNANFRSLVSNSGIFDSLKVGDVAISGDCISAGSINSVKMNSDGDPISSLNLDDGTFNYADGKLTYDGETLSVEILDASNIKAGILKSQNYDADAKTGSMLNLDDGTFSYAGDNLSYDGDKLFFNGDIYATDIKLLEDATIRNADDKDILDGYISVGNAIIGDDASFNVLSDGQLKAKNASISGEINAESGTIGGFTIKNNNFYSDYMGFTPGSYSEEDNDSSTDDTTSTTDVVNLSIYDGTTTNGITFTYADNKLSITGQPTATFTTDNSFSFSIPAGTDTEYSINIEFAGSLTGVELSGTDSDFNLDFSSNTSPYTIENIKNTDNEDLTYNVAIKFTDTTASIDGYFTFSIISTSTGSTGSAVMQTPIFWAGTDIDNISNAPFQIYPDGETVIAAESDKLVIDENGIVISAPAWHGESDADYCTMTHENIKITKQQGEDQDICSLSNVGLEGSGPNLVATSSLDTCEYYFGKGGVHNNSTYYKSISSSYTALRINSDGYFGTSVSSKRFKTDISYDIAPDFNVEELYNLKPAKYKYKAEYGDVNELHIGFIAEDVAEHFPAAACFEKDGVNVYTWNEREMIPGLLALIQEQKKEIEDLQARVEILEKERE